MEDKKPTWEEVLSSFEPTSRADAPDIPDSSTSETVKLQYNQEIVSGLNENYDNLRDDVTFSPNEFIGQIAIRLGIKDVTSDRTNYKELNVGTGIFEGQLSRPLPESHLWL